MSDRRKVTFVFTSESLSVDETRALADALAVLAITVRETTGSGVMLTVQTAPTHAAETTAEPAPESRVN